MGHGGLANGSPSGLPIAEAAEVLGLSATAVRKRVKRGSLAAHKGPDGCWYVEIEPGSPPGHTIDQPALVARLTDEVAFLRRELERRGEELSRERESREAEQRRRAEEVHTEQERRAEELRRKDVLLAEFAQRIAELSNRLPELPATAAAPAAQGLEPRPGRTSWWKRLLYGPGA